MKKQIRVSVLALFLTVLAIFKFGTIDAGDPKFSEFDLHAYIAMSEAVPGIVAECSSPFAYRLMGPWLVGLFTDGGLKGFYSFAIIFGALLSFAFYRYLRISGLSSESSLLALAMFLFNSNFFGFVIWNSYQLGDLLSFFFLAILFWQMEKGKSGLLLGGVLFMGILARESVVLFAPTYFVFCLEKGHSLKKALLAQFWFLPAAILFVGIRMGIPTGAGESLLEAIMQHGVKLGSLETWYRLFINAFVPVSFFPLIFFRSVRSYFWEHPHRIIFALLVCLSTLFGSDNERLMAPVFIVYYGFIGYAADAHGLLKNKKLLWLLVLAVVLGSHHHIIARFPMGSRNLTIVLSLVSLLLASLWVYIVLKSEVRAQHLEEE